MERVSRFSYPYITVFIFNNDIIVGKRALLTFDKESPSYDQLGITQKSFCSV